MGIAEDLDILDSKIARLKVEYEQYFMRLTKREPAKLRDEVEKLVLFYSNKNLTNSTLKFKYNSLVSRYNSYKQYWTRTLRSIEEGTFARKAEGDVEGSKLRSPETPVHRHSSAAARIPEKHGPDADVEEIYQKYIEARKACNEPTEGLTVDSLAKTVEQYKKKVEEQYKTRDVEFKVYVKDGKAKLTITPKGKT